jgi:hypothetical protein
MIYEQRGGTTEEEIPSTETAAFRHLDQEGDILHLMGRSLKISNSLNFKNGRAAAFSKTKTGQPQQLLLHCSAPRFLVVLLHTPLFEDEMTLTTFEWRRAEQRGFLEPAYYLTRD